MLACDFCSGELWSSVSSCLPNIGGSGLPRGLTSLMDLRAIDFSVCLAFHLPLEYSVDFHFLNVG